MKRVGLSLGSNLGDRLATLESACDALAEAFGHLRLSQVYETEPVGCPEGSPPYLNACVEIATELPPKALLRVTQGIEDALGRRRSGVYGEPRSCDIDILYYDTETVDAPGLTIPHPRAHERAFVLRPLADIDPQLVLPGQSATVAELLATLPAAEAAGVAPFAL